MKKRDLRRFKAAAVFLAAVILMTACGSSGAEGSAAQAGGTREKETGNIGEEEPGSAREEENETVQAAQAAGEEGEEENETGQAAQAAGEDGEKVTLTLFAAKSLQGVMEDVIETYTENHPGVDIIGNYDSSGTLMTQIREGAACDIFFSAAQKQMNQLEEEGLLEAGTRHNVVNNQVVVVTWRGSGTAVTGLRDLEKASSMALADGSVPVGKYTRQALVGAGLLEAPADGADVSEITTQQVSEALGGLEINECANVGAVAAAVSEGSNEVGTVYYSDTCGMEDRLEILETVPYDLTGDVIYPVAQIINPEASDPQRAAAREFVDFIISGEAKEIFRSYCFDTDVTD